VRALAVFHLAATSGPSRSLEAELAWLAGEGELDVVVPGPGAVAETFGAFARVHTLSYEALTLPRGLADAVGDGRRIAAEAAAFRSLIGERRPELVVVASAMLPAVLIASRRQRVPAIVYAGELFGRAGGEPMAGSRAATLAKAIGGRGLARLTAALADAVLACSGTVAAQYGGPGRARVEVLYPPIPDYSGGARDRGRAGLGAAPGDRLLVTVGNITRNRGQDVLIAALPAIRAEVPEARAAIVGDPHPRPQDLAFRDELESLAARLGVGGAVTFAPHTERVGDVYAAADVVVNPRRSGEAFGRVPCEALLAGRPVIAMREGAVPEILRDGETALLVPPGDPGSLAGAAVRLLADERLRSRLVAAGRRDVARRFAPERSLATFRRTVAEVLAAREGASR
jgi:glycosyltransferase involved in cell wall biosynthesis